LREDVAHRSVAAIDVDDVLYPCTQILLDDLNQRHGTQVTMEELDRFGLQHNFSHFRGSHDRLMQYLLQEVEYMKCEALYDYARPMMQRIHKEGIFTLVITARGFHPLGYRNTHDLLTQSDVPFDGLATTHLQYPKLDFILEHFDHEVAIAAEDGPTALRDFYDGTDAHVIRFERPWNVDSPHHSSVPMNATTKQVTGIIENALNSVHAHA
jgi:hypothetical protein